MNVIWDEDRTERAVERLNALARNSNLGAQPSMESQYGLTRESTELLAKGAEGLFAQLADAPLIKIKYLVDSMGMDPEAPAVLGMVDGLGEYGLKLFVMGYLLAYAIQEDE